MTQTTITEFGFITQGGYRVPMQAARCRWCAGRIERIVSYDWGHASNGRAICLLPADATKVATPE